MTNFFPNRDAATDPLLDRLRASTIGLYDVAGEIGRGGMAVVYIATDLRLGRRVAIKVMEPRLNFTPGMAERFLQEARIAAQLQHHNIIVVHEVRHDDELIFFVMRLVDGGSLDEICRRLAQRQRQIPIDQAQWILWQSARALAYAHSEGIIHRDIKPANILISTKGEVVVTDFGIAKAVDAEGLTKSGMAIGTPTYMSPEQFVGQGQLSGAADQYSLGIAAYEMLTGAPPFTGDLYRMIAAHGSTPAPDIREKRPDCPDPLADAVMRMLAKLPADRWPSLDAALPVLGQGLAIDGSSTRADLATVAVELQTARAASVGAWSALTPVTPPWSGGGTWRSKAAARLVPAVITVSPPSAQVVTGKQVYLRAVVTSDNGTTVGDAVITWSSSDPAVATVTPDGAVTGICAGAVTVGAEVVVRDGTESVVRALAEVSVSEHAVARVHIREGDQAIDSGDARRLTAELFDENGGVVEGAVVEWASSDLDVVYVDAQGTVLALAHGHAVVSARVRGVQGSVRIAVEASALALTESASITDALPKQLFVTEPDAVSVMAPVSSKNFLPADPISKSAEFSDALRLPKSRSTARPVLFALTAVVLVAALLFARRDSLPTFSSVAVLSLPKAGRDSNRTPAAPMLAADAKSQSASIAPGDRVDSAHRVTTNGSLTNSANVQRSIESGRQKTSDSSSDGTMPKSLPRQGRAKVARTDSSRTIPPPATSVDVPVELAPPKLSGADATGLSDNEMRQLSRQYVLRLERGEFRTGSLASFFSSATSAHHATLVGEAHVARREGDALFVDVDLQLERTMGSGVVQRRATSVRLVMRGRPGTGVIESATPGVLVNVR